MRKIQDYREAFGGTYVEAYEALVDMGEVRESDGLRSKVERLDRAEVK